MLGYIIILKSNATAGLDMRRAEGLKRMREDQILLYGNVKKVMKNQSGE